MPCKQVLLALELRRERRRLRAACAHDRCAPLLRHHHHHRSRQHQRHNHGISDDNGENDHRMIVIGERAIDLRCIFSFQDEIAMQTSQLRDGGTKPCKSALRDGRTKPCAVRSAMAGRQLATGQRLVYLCDKRPRPCLSAPRRLNRRRSSLPPAPSRGRRTGPPRRPPATQRPNRRAKKQRPALQDRGAKSCFPLTTLRC